MNNEYLEFIQSKTDIRSQYEMLSEECAELSQASIKMIRTMYKGNPTNISMYEAVNNINEEIEDLLIILTVIGKDITQIMESIDSNPKWKRWAERIRDDR